MAKNEGDYHLLKLRKYGYPAYAINRLVGLIGNNEQEVLEQIVQEWLSENWERLRDFEITVQNARAEGYIQAKSPKPFRVVR
jgi:hypothetical protein